jgi:alpha-N-arabinofuranosidase
VVDHLVIADDDIRAANTEDRPDRVTPRQAAVPQQAGSAAEVVLPAVSWNVVRLQRAPA